MSKQKRLLTYHDSTDQKRQHKSPCSDCPFARTALPGWLAGKSVGWWLNVAHGDGRMECHTRTVKGENCECAGAAIYRSNVCKLAPDTLDLPADKKKVFGWDDEFASHHLGRPVSKKEASEMKCAELFASFD